MASYRVASGKKSPPFDATVAERLVRDGLSTGQVARLMGFTGPYAVQRWAHQNPEMKAMLQRNAHEHQKRQSKRGMK